ncbi:non-homologous end joining protein Ku [Streptomyces sp. HF10]|uniref:non-homologous end joining protein Ku n=1 Tax=Streptomyces sp. HF10 TaxID=2692233 RepID=UPI001318EF75|nr:Ku protein [Streptomyces sp. HF10]QHC33884.1 Ku protein [Streptomyces sp. HF10]
MPRTIWSGAISFGLVTVPINVQSATEDHSIHFRQYHLADQSRIRYRKVCELENREVDQSEIGKGYELTKTQIIPITDDDLSNLPLPTARAIEIDAFVPLDSIDPIRIGDGYYLQPSSQVAAKPYKLLVQALGRSAKVAIAKYAWSGRERLGILRVRDDVLVLHAMHWPDEIRDPAELLPPPVQVSDQEIEGALALMDTMAVDDLVGPEFEDHYTEAVAQIIKAKRDENPLPEAPEPQQPAKVLDLMTALQECRSSSRRPPRSGPRRRPRPRRRPEPPSRPWRASLWRRASGGSRASPPGFIARRAVSPRCGSRRWVPGTADGG